MAMAMRPLARPASGPLQMPQYIERRKQPEPPRAPAVLEEASKLLMRDMLLRCFKLYTSMIIP